MREQGVPTLKHLRNIIMINVLLILIFVASDYFQWSTINHYTTTSNLEIIWNPLIIHWNHFIYVPNGNNVPDGFEQFPNYQFWLFLISTAVNLYFTAKLARGKETKP